MEQELSSIINLLKLFNNVLMANDGLYFILHLLELMSKIIDGTILLVKILFHFVYIILYIFVFFC